jgi:molecular chaperone HtpG
MPAEQKAIYFVAAENLATARSSPHIEALRQKGFEVLYMTDVIDEWVVDALREYSGKPFTSAAKGGLDLPETEDDKKKKEERAKSLSTVLERLKVALGTHVKDVRVTDRLTDSPACLVSDEYGMSARQERILREAGHQLPEMKRTLELNPEHAVVVKLQAMTDDAKFAEWSELLYDQALLAEGALPADPGAFAKKVARLMAES